MKYWYSLIITLITATLLLPSAAQAEYKWASAEGHFYSHQNHHATRHHRHAPYGHYAPEQRAKKWRKEHRRADLATRHHKNVPYGHYVREQHAKKWRKQHRRAHRDHKYEYHDDHHYYSHYEPRRYRHTTRSYRHDAYYGDRHNVIRLSGHDDDSHIAWSISLR